MDTLSEFLAVLGPKETLKWGITVLTAVLLIDSWRGIIAQAAFFKANETESVIHEKTNGTLLRYVLGILNTSMSTNAETVVSFFAALLFCVPIFLEATSLISVVSNIMQLAIVITLVLSRRSNRIVKSIESAKPTLKQ